jgi:hypothetical protein
LCIYGGFTSEGIAGDLAAARILKETADETADEIGNSNVLIETIRFIIIFNRWENTKMGNDR